MHIYRLINKVGVLSLLLLSCAVLHAQEQLYPNTFPLSDVQLLDGPFKHARDLNIETLLQYKVDRLLAPFRKEAGLTPKDSSYANWIGLDGHIGGHYLSAMAMNIASTKNEACKQRLEYMIDELKACQNANTKTHPDWAKGYVGGVPNSAKIWSALQNGNFTAYRAAWVPWYNVHKLYAGLRDAWLYAENETAKEIFLRFCDWGIQITSKLSDTRMQQMLDVEHGGMNEIFADAYQMTGDQKYLVAAKRFSHRQLLDPLARGIDKLDNKHANTQVPKAIGFQRIGELTHDSTYLKAGKFFWETVTGNRTLAFGGNSRREFFPSPAACTDFVRDVEGPESCNTYNMLKLTQDLFRLNPQAKYIDFYERALYNHILSTQHPQHGGYVYFTPVRPRHYRVYSAPNKAMWCCVGSGMENHGKYNEFIYAHQNDSLFLNLFIASTLNWRDKGIQIKQETQFPEETQTRLIMAKGDAQFTLMVRYPAWVKQGELQVMVNGKPVSFHAQPASFVAINRYWKQGDSVRVILPMHTTVERMPHVPRYMAILHGPIVLGAKTGMAHLNGLIADDSRWGHIASGEKLPVNQAPIIREGNPADVATKLVPVQGKPLHFTFANDELLNTKSLELEPFYKIHDARYMLYWMMLNHGEYKTYLDSLARIEKEQVALQKRTVDFVAPGEQQPEVDHALIKKNSHSGNFEDTFWRDAKDGGYFGYLMATEGQTNLSLYVKYWGAEWGNRKFDIYVDDERLLTIDNTGKWNESAFKEETYLIPVSFLQGKKQVRIRFQPLPGNTAGAVYYIRLVKPEK